MSEHLGMRADTQPVAADAGKPDFLLGTWVNTDPHTTSIARAVIDRDGDGNYRLHTYGHFGQRLKSWGEITIATHVAAHGQAGFHGQYRLDGIHMDLAANNKLGVLVILCCTSFHDNSGRPNYMARSFFCREDIAPAGTLTMEALRND